MNPDILIVEDDAAYRALMGKALGGIGCLVHDATASQDGFQRALAIHPRLIIADILLPGGDGIELCRKIKEHPSLKEIPVLMVTSADGLGSRRRAAAAGADGYLSKPFRLKALLHAVQTLASGG